MTNTEYAGPSFSNLTGRLLKGGLAPKHVSRIVEELKDHFFDLREEALREGIPKNDAEARALSRLGKEDDLVLEALSKTELRSWTSRYPWALYGLAPAITSFLVTVLLILSFTTLAAGWTMPVGTEIQEGTKALVGAGIFFALYVLPLLVAAFVCYQATLRGDSLGWPVLGLAVLSLCAVTLDYNLGWPTLEAQGSLGIGFNAQLNTQALVRTIASLSCITISMFWFRNKFSYQEDSL